MEIWEYCGEGGDAEVWVESALAGRMCNLELEVISSVWGVSNNRMRGRGY